MNNESVRPVSVQAVSLGDVIRLTPDGDPKTVEGRRGSQVGEIKLVYSDGGYDWFLLTDVVYVQG